MYVGYGLVLLFFGRHLVVSNVSLFSITYITFALVYMLLKDF